MLELGAFVFGKKTAIRRMERELCKLRSQET